MRWWALIVLFVATPAAAQKVEHIVDWQRRVFPVRGTADVEIRTQTGKVHVVAGPEGRVQVSGTIKTVGRDPEAAKNASHLSNILADADGDKVLVEVQEKDPPHGGTAVDLVVEVPPRSIVKVRGLAASVDAQRLMGMLDVQTRVGSVQVGLAGPANVHAETKSGRIDQDVGLSMMKKGRTAVAEGRYGGGGPAVNLSTGQGNIAVHPAR